MEFAKFCLETRLKLGLSQETLARKLDVSFATVNRWENGKAVPQKLTLYRFKKFCEDNGIEFTPELNALSTK
ncbi:MAG: helix-turn-helix transcriptional regulator [Clostridia bacterium]|nr:helix-turn-helix transcriptional regulator [Clostridia bacterium]